MITQPYYHYLPTKKKRGHQIKKLFSDHPCSRSREHSTLDNLPKINKYKFRFLPFLQCLPPSLQVNLHVLEASSYRDVLQRRGGLHPLWIRCFRGMISAGWYKYLFLVPSRTEEVAQGSLQCSVGAEHRYYLIQCPKLKKVKILTWAADSSVVYNS